MINWSPDVGVGDGPTEVMEAPGGQNDQDGVTRSDGCRRLALA
jgi:hypothetical protein